MIALSDRHDDRESVKRTDIIQRFQVPRYVKEQVMSFYSSFLHSELTGTLVLCPMLRSSVVVERSFKVYCSWCLILAAYSLCVTPFLYYAHFKLSLVSPYAVHLESKRYVSLLLASDEDKDSVRLCCHLPRSSRSKT
jgi:hypothetical protein